LKILGEDYGFEGILELLQSEIGKDVSPTVIPILSADSDTVPADLKNSYYKGFALHIPNSWT